MGQQINRAVPRAIDPRLIRNQPNAFSRQRRKILRLEMSIPVSVRESAAGIEAARAGICNHDEHG